MSILVKDLQREESLAKNNHLKSTWEQFASVIKPDELKGSNVACRLTVITIA